MVIVWKGNVQRALELVGTNLRFYGLAFGSWGFGVVLLWDEGTP